MNTSESPILDNTLSEFRQLGVVVADLVVVPTSVWHAVASPCPDNG